MKNLEGASLAKIKLNWNVEFTRISVLGKKSSRRTGPWS